MYLIFEYFMSVPFYLCIYFITDKILVTIARTNVNVWHICLRLPVLLVFFILFYDFILTTRQCSLV